MMMLAILGLDTGEFLAIIMFVVFMVMILTGYNVAFSFASTALVFSFIGDYFDAFDPKSLNGLPLRWANALEDQSLLAVPLFVLMGAILERSGLAERLLTAIGMLMGPLRGGVAAAVIVVGTLLAAATGVVAATVIVMGLLSLPTMVRLGYDHKLATGAITASGTLAQLLPPSLVLILLAQQIGVGILGLFAGALIPGLLLSGLYVIYTLGISYLRPEVGPAMPESERTLTGEVTTRHSISIALSLAALLGLVSLAFSWRAAICVFIAAFVVILGALLARSYPAAIGSTVAGVIAAAVVGTAVGVGGLTTLIVATGVIGLIMGLTAVALGSMLATEVIVAIVPTVLLIVGVLASIFQGIATPSEAGAVGVFGALLLGVMNYWYDKMLHADGGTHVEPTWRMTSTAMREAATSTANITILVMTLIFSSSFFSLMFFQLGGSDKTAEWLTAIGGGKIGFVIVAMIAVFLLGVNLEFLEITFIVVPIFVPAMVELGFTDVEKIWFTVLMAVNLNMAFISPPVGFSLFYLQSVAPPEIKTADIHKGAIPFMVLQGIALLVLGVFPSITEFSYNLFTPN